jgi:hypothetical protein
VRVSARMWVTRLAVAAVITAAIMFGAVAWAANNQPPAPKPKTIEKVVETTPEGCAQFVKDADAFVSVTSAFLGAQNQAVESIFDGDRKGLDEAVEGMEHLQDRYDEVMDRYSESRAGCLT